MSKNMIIQYISGMTCVLCLRKSKASLMSNVVKSKLSLHLLSVMIGAALF